jgi:23S rRNA (pseudouridine1915-N3)-methyltransferase
MQILIIAVGKLKEKYLQEGIAEYKKRLPPYVKLNILEVAEEKKGRSQSSSQEILVKDREGVRILAAIPKNSVVIVLDVNGVFWSSETLAENLRHYEIAGKNQITFVIGGDLGLSDSVIARGNVLLSLSLMTFTHQMIRLVLIEQIYRACKINSDEPYHK